MEFDFLLKNFERYYRGEILRDERLTFLEGVGAFWDSLKPDQVPSCIQKLMASVAHHPPRLRMSRYLAFFTLLSSHQKARNFDVVEFRDLGILGNAMMPGVLKDEWFDYFMEIFEKFEGSLEGYPAQDARKREMFYNEIYWRRGKVIALLWLTRPGFFWPVEGETPLKGK